MKDEIIKTMGKFMAILGIVLLLIVGIQYQASNSYISGTIVGKHTTGYNNDVYYLTVSNDEKTMDVEVNSGQYNKYPLFEKVYVDYNLLRKVVSITQAKETN